jgi:ABC-type glycerol-3-phosphate transport system substrate-binding protein
VPTTPCGSPRALASGRRSRLWTRRQLAGAGAVLLFGSGAGAALGACAGPAQAPSATQPTVSQPVTELTFMPWWIFWDAAGRAIVQQGADMFAQSRRGLRLKALPGPQGGGANTTDVIASMLAGTGPDVVADCCGSWMSYTSLGAFANLNTYLKRDNIDLSAWSTGQIKALQTPDGQFGLPVYHGPVVLACRLDLLDSLGLEYPDPDWTHTQAADFWTRCAGPFQANGKSQWRYGANFPWSSHGWYAQSYLLYGFGGAEMDPTRTKALFDQPGSIQAGQWIFPLLWAKVLGPRTGSIQDGTAVFELAGGWSIPRNVTTYGTKFKWDYVPMPKFPKGRATFANNDFWGINAQSKHPDAAWEVLKWLAYEDDWQRFCMKATLIPPSKVALWAEFEAQLVAAAPPLKDKGLKWFRDAAEGGYGYPQEFFRYSYQQADALIGQVMGKIFDRNLDVEGGFRQLTQQLDALEQAGAVTEGAARSAQQRFPTTGPALAPVPVGI